MEEVIVVSEEAIAGALRLVYERLKIVIEPSAAVGVAALLSSRFHDLVAASRASPAASSLAAAPAGTAPDAAASPLRLDRVGVVLCGGNADFALVAPLLAAAPSAATGVR